MTEIGRLATTWPNDSDEDPDTPREGICPSLEDLSRFASKVKLVKLLHHGGHGKHDRMFDMART